MLEIHFKDDGNIVALQVSVKKSKNKIMSKFLFLAGEKLYEIYLCYNDDDGDYYNDDDGDG